MEAPNLSVQQHAADVAAASSTAIVAAYSLTDILEPIALVVAIVSGGLAASWHLYRYWQEWKERKK